MVVSKESKSSKTVAVKKSGIRTFKAGDVLFNGGDNAQSLYIIQKGQIRLYIPKGRGFVDIGILRSGEVIGEMAFFDEKSRRRSCSAQAIVSTDVIEISFDAFGATIKNLNPWFKTIINTLADRLRKTNDKVKALESNSVSFGKGGKVADYKFFHSIDIVKALSMIYLVFKTHASEDNGSYVLEIGKLKFYLIEIYNFQEIKFEEILKLFSNLKIIEVKYDISNIAKEIIVFDIGLLRRLLVFFNTQRNLENSKQLNISSRCEKILSKIIDQFNVRKIPLDTETAEVNLSQILQDFKTRNIPMSEDDLRDAIVAGFVGDIMVGDEKNMYAEVQYKKLMQVFPGIKLTNAVKQINEEKSQPGS